MDPATITAVVGLATAAKGLLDGNKASKNAQKAQAAITAASIKAEGLRKDQMLLENSRRQRDIIRQAQIARSTAVAGATASGSRESSGFFGGQGQISGLMGQGLTAQRENTTIGLGLFQANVDRMNAEMALGRARSDQSTASGLFQLGSSLVTNSQAIGKNATSLFGGGASGGNPYNPAAWGNTTTVYGGT